MRKLLKSAFIFMLLVSFASCSNDEVINEAEPKMETLSDNDKIKQFEEAVRSYCCSKAIQ